MNDCVTARNGVSNRIQQFATVTWNQDRWLANLVECNVLLQVETVEIKKNNTKNLTMSGKGKTEPTYGIERLLRLPPIKHRSCRFTLRDIAIDNGHDGLDDQNGRQTHFIVQLMLNSSARQS
jgi:hypothetical protein